MAETSAVTTAAVTNAVTLPRISELEAIIERGFDTFVKVGAALLEISEQRLYREQGFGTFKEYCETRWTLSPKAAYQYIQAYEVAGNVQTSGQIPANVNQAALLAPLPPDQQREVARRVVFSNTTISRLKEEIQRVKNPESEANKAYSFKRRSLRRHLTEHSFKSEIKRLTRRYIKCHRAVTGVRVEVQEGDIQVDICIRNADGQQRGAA
jgi:hypothetical protein